MVTYPRVEIPDKVKREVFTRAGGPGQTKCEGDCKLPVKPGGFQYHHDFPEWLQQIPPSQRDPITAKDVLLLCTQCHAVISGKDSTARAHIRRVVDKQAGIKKAKGRGFNKRYRQKMDGSVWDTQTGQMIKGPRS